MEEVELTPFQEEIEKLVLSTKPRGKHSARNAIRHIKRAWKLREIEPEIAVFCAITGEEEAATAIFHSLKRQNYLGADQLKPHNHVHKAAVFPFFIAAGLALAPAVNELVPKVEIDTNSETPQIKLRFKVMTPEGERHLYPLPPLHFSFRRNGEIYYFSDEFQRIADSNQISSIDKQIKILANERNELLYAHDGGILTFTEPIDGIIKDGLDKIFKMLIVFLLIDQYSESQWFVQQSLNAFLTVLGKLPPEFNFE